MKERPSHGDSNSMGVWFSDGARVNICVEIGASQYRHNLGAFVETMRNMFGEQNYLLTDEWLSDQLPK